MPRANAIAAALVLLFALGLAQPQNPNRLGSFAIKSGKLPLIAGSIVQLQTAGAPPAISFTLTGPGTIDGGVYRAPVVRERTTSEVVAAGPGAVAATRFTLVPPPLPRQPLIAVASYDDGVVLHDARTFAVLGTYALGGPPGDVAFARNGTIYAPDTDGQTLSVLARDPWTTTRIPNVLTGNEVAADPGSNAIFVTDRDIDGKGALTRVDDAQTQRILTGETAEGIAIDARRSLVYVGNVNDATVAVVDAHTMRMVRRLRAAPRVFGIALDKSASRLFIVANISPDMRIGSGYVAAIDLRAGGAIAARSPGMPFPLGIAYDAQKQRLFVTDESTASVGVLSAQSLKPQQQPLSTCRVPWRPYIAHGRLFVPCTASNAIDVFDLKTLRRVHGAPFRTGGYPLSVAEWP